MMLRQSFNKRGNKGVYTFPKGISPKVKVIARLKFELAYYDIASNKLASTTRGIRKEKGRKEGKK